MKQVLILTLALALAAPATAAAAEEAPAIIVTATRTAQIADATLAPVIVISREDIARTPAHDVADLLKQYAGLDIARNGGPGQVTSLFIRGTDSNHALVMIDGVKINPGTIGGAALQNINPELIERIEIVKGPRSTLYGSEAIGGVINIITRRAAATQVLASIKAGDHNTTQYTLGGQHVQNQTRAGLSASQFTTDGIAPLAASPQTRGYDNTNFNAYAGTQLGAVDMELSHWQATGNTEYLDNFSLTPLDQDYENMVTALTFKLSPTTIWASTLKLSYMTDKIDQKQSTDYAHTLRSVMDWQNDVQLSAAQLLSAGLMLSEEDTDASVFGTGYAEITRSQAVYVQDDITRGAHHVLLAARYTDHEAFGGHSTWDAEYGYRLSARTRLTAAIGTAFRAPDSTDRFGYGGNPTLDPETSRNIEAGLQHSYSERQAISINIFENRIKDLIEYDMLSSTMRNTGRAKITGAEITYSLHLRPWGARLSAIVQDPQNEDTGEALARRAKRSASASVFYDSGRYLLSADLLAQSHRKDSAFSTFDNAGYGILNLSAQARLGQVWLLGLKGENVLDKAYELAYGYNTPGQAWYVDVSYNMK